MGINLYGSAEIAGKVSPFAVTTSEQDVLVLLDSRHARRSQLSVFADFSLGAATSIQLRYYQTPDGINWYQIPIKNAGSGELATVPSVLDAGSPTKVVEDVANSSSLGFKVTAQSVGASATINNLYVLARNN